MSNLKNNLATQAVQDEHAPSDAGKKNTNHKAVLSIFPQEWKQISKSWLLWRIILTVALIITLIQSITLIHHTSEMEQSYITHLQTDIESTLKQSLDLQTLTIKAQNAQALLENTPLTGLAFYSYDQNDLANPLQTAVYGKSTTIKPQNIQTQDVQSLTFNWINLSTDHSEVWIKTADTLMIASFDTSKAILLAQNYAVQSTIASIVTTILVSLILVILISHWLLDPILFIRKNLIEATQNPENPNIEDYPYNPDDEIGNVAFAAEELIKQNSTHIQQTKSSAESRIYKLAYFDTLTTLPNRSYFLQQVERAIKPMDGSRPKQFYIIAIDLDNFKDVNDSMGHNVGDSILRGVGKRLKNALPETAIVSRTGEDEFAVMVDMPADEAEKTDVGSQIIDIIRKEPFKVFNENLQIRASAGIVAYPHDGTEAPKLLKNADIALNKAKEEGRNIVKEYSEDFERAIQERFTLLRDLRLALENEELQLYYQPQLDLKSGRVIGAEALLRWWKAEKGHPNGGFFVSPGDFIPAAEQSGLIVPIGEWVMRQACKDAQEWNEKYGFNMRVAVNISAVQFLESDIAALTQDILTEFNLAPDRIELEVTESAFMEDINQTIQTLKKLHNLGIELAIDDFGTGYSSLSYLRQFPIDRLKIDQSFIRDALNNPDDASITKTIIALGRSLNLKVIAEGVETREHENFLISEGCDEVQGFRYSKPVKQEQFVEFCKEYNGDLRSFSQV